MVEPVTCGCPSIIGSHPTSAHTELVPTFDQVVEDRLSDINAWDLHEGGFAYVCPHCSALVPSGRRPRDLGGSTHRAWHAAIHLVEMDRAGNPPARTARSVDAIADARS